MPTRRYLLLGLLTALSGTATLYAFPPDQFGFYPSCPVHDLTGLLCPGCGGTRAIAALLHGHLAEAWHFNALVVAALPAVAAYLAVAAQKDRWPGMPRSTVALLLALTLAFGVARNLV